MKRYEDRSQSRESIYKTMRTAKPNQLYSGIVPYLNLFSVPKSQDDLVYI